MWGLGGHNEASSKMIWYKLYARFMLVREKELYKDVIQDFSTVNQKPCKYSSVLVQSHFFYHVMSCTCQALSELLFVPLQISPVPTAHPPPRLLQTSASSFSWKHSAGIRWPLQKTTSSEWGNEHLFILKYEKSGALEHEDDRKF